MASLTTESILELTEKVTGPIKNIVQQIQDASDDVSGLELTGNFTEKETKEALKDIRKAMLTIHIKTQKPS